MKDRYISHTYPAGQHMQRDCQKNPKKFCTDISIVVGQLFRMNAIKNGLIDDEMPIVKVLCIYITLQKTERVRSRYRSMVNWN